MTRDFLQATRERVVVFDGGMGATLETFDLSLEDDYALPGRAHEVLNLRRPDVIRDVHAAMVAAGAEVAGDQHVPGQPPQARRVGTGRPHARDQRHRRAARPRRGRRGPLRRRLHGPDRAAPRLRRPDARRDHARSSCATSSRSRSSALLDGGVDLLHHRDGPGHPRGEGRDPRRAPRDARRPSATCRSRSPSPCCPRAGRCCSAPTSTPRSRRWRRSASTSSA